MGAGSGRRLGWLGERRNERRVGWLGERRKVRSSLPSFLKQSDVSRCDHSPPQSSRMLPGAGRRPCCCRDCSDGLGHCKKRHAENSAAFQLNITRI